jgi:hypothetical protein
MTISPVLSGDWRFGNPVARPFDAISGRSKWIGRSRVIVVHEPPIDKRSTHWTGAIRSGIDEESGGTIKPGAHHPCFVV